QGEATRYQGGLRAGDDVLVTNVHAFDVKVYDERAHYAGPGQCGADLLPGMAGVDDDGNGLVDFDLLGNPDFARSRHAPARSAPVNRTMNGRRASRRLSGRSHVRP